VEKSQHYNITQHKHSISIEMLVNCIRSNVYSSSLRTHSRQVYTTNVSALRKYNKSMHIKPFHTKKAYIINESVLRKYNK